MVVDKIPNEFELAEKFGVGCSIICEAVKSLSSKCVLEGRQGSGTFVISPSTVEDGPLRLACYDEKLQLILELFDACLMIESEIVASVVVNVVDDGAKRIMCLCDEVEKFYRSGENRVRKDIEFHKKNRSLQQESCSR